MTDTRERILTAALELFAKKGYDATSASDIAEAIGVTKGALYRHFDSKRDILDNILRRMEETDRRRAIEHGMPEGEHKEMPEKYGKTKLDDLIEYSISEFRYWTRDEFASSFRRMLTLEQYKSREMAELYANYLTLGPIGYVEDILSDAFGREDAKLLAVEFYAPMFFLYAVHDAGRDEDAERLLHEHFDRFRKRLEDERAAIGGQEK